MAEVDVVLFYRASETRISVERALAPPLFRVISFDLSSKLPTKIKLSAKIVLVEFEGGDEAEVRVAWLRGIETLAQVPIVALGCGAGASGEALALSNGAEAFFNLSDDDELLRARVNALLRASSRARKAAQRAQNISGSLKDVAPLRLLKFCEDRRLSGRLSVRNAQGASWIEFLGGELVNSGSSVAGGQEPLDSLLAAREGTFLIEQTPLGVGAAALMPALNLPNESTQQAMDNEASIASAGSAAPLMPSGRLSIVKEAPHLAPYHVQTEGENRPNFTVTTLVTQDGRVVRKTRTEWQHPLMNPEDRALAQTQLDRQHERVMTKMRELTAAAAAPPLPARPSGVNGLLLGWAMHFIVEQAWGRLGTTVTATLLRRTHAALLSRYPVLKLYRVWVEGRVDFDASQGATLSNEAVEAVARWGAAFLSIAGRLIPEIRRTKIQQVTALMEHALDQVGFYAAFEGALSEMSSGEARAAAGSASG